MTRPIFAAIGHQPDWSSIASMVDGVRQRERADAKPLCHDALTAIMDNTPPRVTSRFKVGEHGVESIYIETFIRPDELGGLLGKEVFGKVERAIAVASREGARVVTLGGFTSIFVEAGAKVPEGAPALTSGNSLTAALIVRGVERALSLLDRNLATEDALVIGAGGDIGSGVSRWLAGRCRSLTLAARNLQRLERERDGLANSAQISVTNDVAGSLDKATLIIAAASTTDSPFPLDHCRAGTLLCDAGYPKNLASSAPQGVRLFHGGMGKIFGGIPSHDGMLERFYRFPRHGVAHGCMLEGAVLALAGRYESYSRGRGNITPERIEKIWSLAVEQGVSPAPLFDDAGLWPEEQRLV